LITEGFQTAYDALVKLLNEFKRSLPIDRNLLIEVARTALRTKLDQKVANHITECVVDAVLAIRKSEQDIEPDLHMIEIMVWKV
jgi:T-complex protein 1 subunit zeta